MKLLLSRSMEQQLGFARPPTLSEPSVLLPSRLCSTRASFTLYAAAATPFPLQKPGTRRRKQRTLGGIVLEKGIFDYPARLKEEEPVREEEAMEEEEEEGDDEAALDEEEYLHSPTVSDRVVAKNSNVDTMSEDGLIPEDWKPLQMDLYKTKADKKRELRLQELENARRKMMLEQQKRQKIRIVREIGAEDGFGQVSLTRDVQETWQKSNIEGSEEFVQTLDFKFREEDNSHLPLSVLNLQLEKEAEAERICVEKRNQRDSELDLLFSEDEKRWLRRPMPELSKVHCDKWPALHVLVSSGQFFLLDRFLKLGIDVDACDEDGYTALQRAVLGRKETAVTQLLRAGANFKVQDKDGASLLHYSVQTCSLNLVRLFLKQRLDVNHPDEAGWTPLHVAIMTGNCDIVRFLLVSGADKLLRTKDGQTSLDICLALGNGFNAYSIAKVLKKFPKVDPFVDEAFTQGNTYA